MKDCRILKRLGRRREAEMKIRVCVAGATGHVGRALADGIVHSEDLALVGAVSRTYKNQNLGIVLGKSEIDLKISGSVKEALETKTDVLVDYTSPQAVKGHVVEAIDRGVSVVIGTSGLTEKDYTEIDVAARDREVGVLAGGNFAITAILMQHFASIAAKHIPHWEIIDYADGRKIDAPSGTARELAERLSHIRRPVLIHAIEDTHGPQESRGATVGGSQIHSIRIPGLAFSTEAIFGRPNEKLVIRHEGAGGGELYVQGTLLGIRKVGSFVGLVRGIERFMDV
jgi:4-hydroxy-tetrahydrodipicolinate reductase